MVLSALQLIIECLFTDFISQTREKRNIELIEHDWKELRKWYEDFWGKQESNDWIAWFDDNFPNHKNIPPVKKIDFIIWAHVSAEDRKNKIKEKQK